MDLFPSCSQFPGPKLIPKTATSLTREVRKTFRTWGHKTAGASALTVSRSPPFPVSGVCLLHEWLVDLSFLFHSLENNWLGTHRAHSDFPFPDARGSFITKLCYLWLLSIAYFYNLNFNTSQLCLVSVTTVLPCLPMSPSLFCHPRTEVSLLFPHFTVRGNVLGFSSFLWCRPEKYASLCHQLSAPVVLTTASLSSFP